MIQWWGIRALLHIPLTGHLSVDTPPRIPLFAPLVSSTYCSVASPSLPLRFLSLSISVLSAAASLRAARQHEHFDYQRPTRQ